MNNAITSKRAAACELLSAAQVDVLDAIRATWEPLRRHFGGVRGCSGWRDAEGRFHDSKVVSALIREGYAIERRPMGPGEIHLTVAGKWLAMRIASTTVIPAHEMRPA